MMFTPFTGLVGGGVPSLATPVGSTAAAMGALGLGLLVLTALVIVLARRWRAS